MTKILNSCADIKRCFAANEVPYYFINASNFNMMGMHDWVRGWNNIALIDSYDHKHMQLLAVPDDPARVFQSIDEINAYMLESPAFRALLAGQGNTLRARAVFLFFDETVEALCRELNIDIVLPPNRLVREIDSKIVTTEIGNSVGVHSVPNVLAKVDCYARLQELAQEAGLGEHWVVQTPYGDSGKTTFFIANAAEYIAVADKIEGEACVKVMRRVNCTGAAIEACATRWGTFVGPLLTELIGIDSLTPYPGGWCGNELYEAAFTPEVRQQVLHDTSAIGDELYRRGYRGYFELDFLIDLDTRAVYLGELNARITGISAMTNMSRFSSDNIPLFLFHLLEYDPEVRLTLDVDAYNSAVLLQGASGIAAQVILKYLESPLQIITQAPVTGVYTMDAQSTLTLQRESCNRLEALATDQVYVLRIMAVGEYAYKGGDLAIMFLNRAIRDPLGKLTADAEQWVGALQACFEFRPLDQAERSMVELAHHPAGMKGGNTP